MRSTEPSDATILGTARVDLYGGTVEHRDSGRTRKVEKAPVTIGRARACDFHVDDRQVSHVHCELLATELGVCIRDHGSSNGTFVDGLRIREAFLTKAARIRVGSTTLDFTPAGVPLAHPLAPSFGSFESQSLRMQAIFGQLRELAPTSVSILFLGESGVGKTHLAQLIHEQSRRAGKPFMKFDLAGLDEAQTNNTLFGHEKGSFTGADRATTSPFLDCDGGTIFLDEIGELTAEQQKRFLRFIDEKIVVPLGSTKGRRVDVRFIFATKQNLLELVNAKTFRDDLFYRLGTRIELPPLSERREDIGLLTKQMLSDRGRVDLYKSISKETAEWMRDYHWEGNLRRLRIVIETALDLLGDGLGPLPIQRAASLSQSFDTQTFRAEIGRGTDALVAALTADGSTIAAAETAARRILLKKLHADCGGVVAEIARRAGVSRNFARKELLQMGIATPESRRKGGGLPGGRRQ